MNDLETFLTSVRNVSPADKREFEMLLRGVAEMAPPDLNVIRIHGELEPHSGGRDRIVWSIAIRWTGDDVTRRVVEGCSRGELRAAMMALACTFEQQRLCYVRLAEAKR